jgi:hypothetical protein
MYDYDDTDWILVIFNCGIAMFFVGLIIFAATSDEQPNPDEQACQEHGGTYVKVFNKDAYYCKGAK